MTDDPLWKAVKAAHDRLSPDSARLVPPSPRWEPAAEQVGPGQPLTGQGLAIEGPTVPTVPTEKHKTQYCPTAEPDAEARAAWEERAAIIEYDGCVSRLTAERLASDELGFDPSA